MEALPGITRIVLLIQNDKSVVLAMSWCHVHNFSQTWKMFETLVIQPPGVAAKLHSGWFYGQYFLFSFR